MTTRSRWTTPRSRSAVEAERLPPVSASLTRVSNINPAGLEQIGSGPDEFRWHRRVDPCFHVDGTRQTLQGEPRYYGLSRRCSPPVSTTTRNVVMGQDRGSFVRGLPQRPGGRRVRRPRRKMRSSRPVKGVQFAITPCPTWDHFAVNLKPAAVPERRGPPGLPAGRDLKSFSDPGQRLAVRRSGALDVPRSADCPRTSPSLPVYTPATEGFGSWRTPANLIDAAGFPQVPWHQFKRSLGSIVTRHARCVSRTTVRRRSRR